MVHVRGGKLCNAVFVLLNIILIAVSSAYCDDSTVKSGKLPSTQYEVKIDPSQWKIVVEAAKKEGRLVICGAPSEEWRKSLVDMFQQEFPEIKVEYTGINGRDFWPRMRKERELGQKLWDLRAGGIEALAYPAKRDGFLDPIRPLLLPENASDSKWVGGLDGLFNDKEKKFMPTYTIYIQRTVAVNRDFIKESEITSSEQLLDPKFKGKIVMQNPTAGASYTALGNLGFMYGGNFLRDLLSKQNVAVTNDNRQEGEWLVRGKYPLAIGLVKTQLIPYIKQGIGKNVIKLEDKIIPVGTGFGGITLMKDAPHPNAAKVYINWLLSQKTQLKLTKNVFLNSRRTDVPPVDKETAVDPSNLSNYRFYSTEENDEITTRFLPIIREALKY